MGLAEITQSRKWKIFMKYIYGWGASVVLLGALFKILHLPGAAYMLVAGMGTEVIIFFLSAFEPLEEEVDWTRVYPQLAGVGEDDEIDVGAPKPAKREREETGDGVKKFDEMLEEAGVGSEVFEKLGDGLNRLTDTASKLSDLSDASAATNKYTRNMEAASDAAGNLSNSYEESAKKVKDASDKVADTYKQSADNLSYSVDNLSDAHSKTAEKLKESGESLEKSYKDLADKMNIDFSPLKEGNKEYSQNVSTLNKNLSALNAIFELQLQESDVDKMMEDLNNSVQESRKYYNEISKLQKKLEALNTVYGNMLTAMNVHTNE